MLIQLALGTLFVCLLFTILKVLNEWKCGAAGLANVRENQELVVE
jgi:hypothetical protein